MKEYKVVERSLKFTNNKQDLEDILNKYAREGWVVRDIADSGTRIVFERDKNR